MKLGQAKVISFINLKGGVGKTTAAVNIAATIAKGEPIGEGSARRPARVLLIDLDPQSNASLTLLKHEEYDKEKTIVRLFKHELERNDSEDSFDLTEVRYESPIQDLNLDLIPSGLDLFDIQDELVKYQRYYLSATDILFNALNKLRESKGKAYTHIIIDCPPSLGLVTLNGLALSNYYIVPTLLDDYSHWGLDKIIERVDTLKRCKANCEVELLGILYSRIDGRANDKNTRWDGEFSKWEQQFRRRFRKLDTRGINSLVFDSRISSADVIRRAEAMHKPLIAYVPPDNNIRKAKDRCQLEWDSLCREIRDRMKALKA